jgi:hypothetical protein
VAEEQPIGLNDALSVRTYRYALLILGQTPQFKAEPRERNDDIEDLRMKLRDDSM